MNSERDKLQEGWSPGEKAMKPLKTNKPPSKAPPKPKDAASSANPPKDKRQ